MTSKQFFRKWKRAINIYAFEQIAGANRNAIHHAIGKEDRLWNPFDEGKVLEKLAQMQRDINKLDPVNKIKKTTTAQKV